MRPWLRIGLLAQQLSNGGIDVRERSGEVFLTQQVLLHLGAVILVGTSSSAPLVPGAVDIAGVDGSGNAGVDLRQVEGNTTHVGGTALVVLPQGLLTFLGSDSSQNLEGCFLVGAVLVNGEAAAGAADQPAGAGLGAVERHHVEV